MHFQTAERDASQFACPTLLTHPHERRATTKPGLLFECHLQLTAGGTHTTSYYALPGATVVRADGVVSYVLTDHLGSASVVLDASGAVVGEQRYYPFGQTRVATGTLPTDRLFTGQRRPAGLGRDRFGARSESAWAELQAARRGRGLAAGDP